MKLTMLYKDQNSGGNGCPSVYATDAGDLVVQGAVLDGATFEQLANVLPGEGAVRISPDVLIGALERLRGQAGQG
jgi:hypothetical protein